MRTQIEVELPAGALIDYWGFCQAIARAISPADEKPIEGSDCIVRKRVRRAVLIDEPEPEDRNPYLSGLQNVLVSDDGRTLEWLLPDSGEGSADNAMSFGQGTKEVIEHFLELYLTDDDRREVAALLPHLPALSYPISDEASRTFLDAYCSLAERPVWEPVLISAADVEAMRAQQRRTALDHQKALQGDVNRGLVTAVDGRHVPVPVLKIGCLISREDAIGYLQRCCLPYAQGVAEPSLRTERGSATREHDWASVGPPIVVAQTRKAAAPNMEEASADGIAPTTRVADEGHAKRSDVGVDTLKRGKIIRLSRVEELTGLQRSSIYNRMNPKSRYYDPSFPCQFSLSETAGGAVGWYEGEVLAWVTRRRAVDGADD